MDERLEDPGWVSAACTLPTMEQPLRVAEFDDLFAMALLGQERVSATRLRWRLDPGAERIARELAGRESGCCSFFAFSFTTQTNGLQLDVEVPTGQVGVLDALTQRAAGRMRA